VAKQQNSGKIKRVLANFILLEVQLGFSSKFMGHFECFLAAARPHLLNCAYLHAAKNCRIVAFYI
jgi:hypothetical protein